MFLHCPPPNKLSFKFLYTLSHYKLIYINKKFQWPSKLLETFNFNLLEIYVLNLRFTNCNIYIVKIENILNKIQFFWNIINKVLNTVA